MMFWAAQVKRAGPQDPAEIATLSNPRQIAGLNL